ncbi:MAG: NADP-dependent oxidoreductase [Bacteroidales bacterium]|nr:NADP-dependent oxidoreductase [Bacteroidales bacterium]MCF8333574.1 NADP-dependent oxidoreductase [Bacteroidales bacterium]
MKSWMITKYGTPSESLSQQEIDIPIPKDDEVLIKTKAASFNPIDYKILRGDLKMVMKLKMPSPIGYDVSGEVVEMGKETNAFQKGDEVYSRIAHMGAMAEYVTAKVDDVSRKPSNINHRQAAGIPLAGLTAYQALFDIAQLQSGDYVFISAGSGGVGSLAIQLARQAGAYVATTTSSVNVDWVKSLGPNQVIDYTRDEYTILLKDYDVVFDTLGGEHTMEAFKILKDGGKLVTIAGEIDNQTAKELGLNPIIRWILSFKARKITREARSRDIMYRYKLMTPNGRQLTEITRLVEEGYVNPVVDSVFPFDKGHEALQRLTEGRAKGKIIVSMEE